MEEYLEDSSEFYSDNNKDRFVRDYSYLKSDTLDSTSYTPLIRFKEDFVDKPTNQPVTDSGFGVSQKAVEAYKFFIQKGYSENEAIGISANLAIESANYDEDVIQGKRRGDGGKAVGLAQWHPDRWSSVQSYLSELNYDPYSFQGQLEGIHYELSNSEKKAREYLEKASDHLEATEIFNRKYERSADFSGKRQGYANKLKKYLAKTKAQTGFYNPAKEFYNPTKEQKVFTTDIQDEGNPNLELLDEEYSTMLSSVDGGLSQVASVIDKKGSSIVQTTENILEGVEDIADKTAGTISDGLSFINTQLANRRNKEVNRDYLERLNDKKYLDSNLGGIGGKILN